MPKHPLPPPVTPECRESLGLSPAVLAKRDIIKTDTWCPNPNRFDYDKFCDPNFPKTIHYSQIAKAYTTIKDYVPTTLLLALSYQAFMFNLRVTVVMPETTPLVVTEKCKGYGATIIIAGRNLGEAKQRAFKLISESKGFYLNGYDHPNVIAGAGTIGIEILEQLPDTDAVLVPVGGGGLIAGVASAVKHLKPKTLIYGIETSKSCGFFKAMDNEHPYNIESEMGLANSLLVPKPGENAFHTARSLIDKMVLVDDDWVARAILHLLEEENLIVEGAGAISLGSLLCLPNVLPELHDKKVVCIISGGNLEMYPLIRVIARAKTIEGRTITLTVRASGGRTDYDRKRIFKALYALDCNVTVCDLERQWLMEDKLLDSYISIQCQTKGYKHACTVKHVMEKLFPNVCEFCDDSFKDISTCACFPKLD